jgi:hypothetical protein
MTTEPSNWEEVRLLTTRLDQAETRTPFNFDNSPQRLLSLR